MAIAECLDLCESTISRELMRNQGPRGYRHKEADGKARLRRFESRKRIKFAEELHGKVEKHLLAHGAGDALVSHSPAGAKTYSSAGGVSGSNR